MVCAIQESRRKRSYTIALTEKLCLPSQSLLPVLTVTILTSYLDIIFLPSSSVPGVPQTFLLLTKFREILGFRGSQNSCGQPSSIKSPLFWLCLVDRWTGGTTFFPNIKLIHASWGKNVSIEKCEEGIQITCQLTIVLVSTVSDSIRNEHCVMAKSPHSGHQD